MASHRVYQPLNPALSTTLSTTTMTTPSLLPCPFCGGRACLDDSVGGAFVSCELCEAQGPFVEWERVDCPESMLLKKQAIQKAQAAAAAAWNQRSAWQPIETAPRDGRDFIAYNEFTGPYITAAKAMPPDDDIRYPIYCWRGVKGSWFPEPTHWQPQPSPPPITS